MYKNWFGSSSNIAILAGLSLSLLAVGCGDDEGSFGSDLEGVYKVVEHTENREGCDEKGESILDENSTEYFKLSAENFFGERFVGYNECDSPDSCHEGISLGTWMFTEKRDDHWYGESSSSGYGSAAEGEQIHCSLGVTRVKAFVDGDHVRMENRDYTGFVMVDTEDECESDLAVARFDDLSCSTYTVIEATTDY